MKNWKGHPATALQNCAMHKQLVMHTWIVLAHITRVWSKLGAKYSSTSSREVIFVCAEVHCCIIMTVCDEQALSKKKLSLIGFQTFCILMMVSHRTFKSVRCSWWVQFHKSWQKFHDNQRSKYKTVRSSKYGLEFVMIACGIFLSET